VYLDFEGEIPNTGRVDRVAEGRIHVQATPTGWSLVSLDGSFSWNIEADPQNPESFWLLPDDRSEGS
jgi:hypothetical protein